MTNLNISQKIIIVLGAVIVIAIGAFPPWTYTFNSHLGSSEKPAGFYFLLSPPATRKQLSLMHGVKIDAVRLSVEWVMALAATGAGILLASKKNESIVKNKC